MRLNAHQLVSAWILAWLALGAGCTTSPVSEPKRTATEQLLLSTATDHALKTADVSLLAGRKVFLDTTNFESYDQKYAIGSIRDLLSSSGARLINDAKEADVIVEARSGALSIDSSKSLFGLPSLPLPIPFAGVLPTPELALFKSQKQISIAKFALLAYEKNSRQHLISSGPIVGKAKLNGYHVLGFISWVRTDIPEESPYPHFRKKKTGK